MAVFWGKIDKSKLEPTFLKDVDELLSKSPFDWYVTEGFRSMARSNELYTAYKAWLDKKGPPAPRAAPAGKSAHNWGLAIDVALDGDAVKPGLQPDWSTKAAGWVWLKANTVPHPRLKNGWSFNDWPHIERYNWQRYIHW